MAALPRWAPWKGPAIPCEPRLALQPQVASESAINYDAVHQLRIGSSSILDLSHLSFTEAMLPCHAQLKKQAVFT